MGSFEGPLVEETGKFKLFGASFTRGQILFGSLTFQKSHQFRFEMSEKVLNLAMDGQDHFKISTTLSSADADPAVSHIIDFDFRDVAEGFH